MGKPPVMLFVESTEPGIILERLLEEKVPAQRRNMRFHPRARPETLNANPLMRIGADYAFFVNGRPVIGIERKSIQDAVWSLVPCPKRPRPSVFRQLENLGGFPIRALLLEGSFPRDMMAFESLLLGVQYWCLRNGIFVFHSSGIGGTVKALKVIYHRLRKSAASASPLRGPAALDVVDGDEAPEHS